MSRCKKYPTILHKCSRTKLTRIEFLSDLSHATIFLCVLLCRNKMSVNFTFFRDLNLTRIEAIEYAIRGQMAMNAWIKIRVFARLYLKQISIRYVKWLFVGQRHVTITKTRSKGNLCNRLWRKTIETGTHCNRFRKIEFRIFNLSCSAMNAMRAAKKLNLLWHLNTFTSTTTTTRMRGVRMNAKPFLFC